MPLPPALKPGGIWIAHTHTLNECSLFFLHFWGTREYKPCWLSEPSDLEAHPWDDRLKSWGARCVV